MKQFKGTPGERLVSDNGVFFDINCGNQKIGDTCASQHEFDNSVHMDGGVAAANAQLIVAAPELLEALQEIMIKFGHVGDASTWSISESVEGVKARAAIAKALGE